MKHKYELIDYDFLTELSDVLEAGLKDGRAANDWQKIPWCEDAEKNYLGRVMSHIVKVQNADRRDKMRHCASIAANAMIIAWHSRQTQGHVHTPIDLTKNGFDWTSALMPELDPIKPPSFMDEPDNFTRAGDLALNSLTSYTVSKWADVMRTHTKLKVGGPTLLRTGEKICELSTDAPPYPPEFWAWQKARRLDFENLDLLEFEPASYRKEIEK